MSADQGPRTKAANEGRGVMGLREAINRENFTIRFIALIQFN